MHDLIERIEKSLNEKKIHPLITIANFLFEFLAIHPFQD
jgi:Fic family protein